MPSMILGGLCFAAISASCYSAVNYLHTKQIATDEHYAVQRAEQGNVELEAAIGRIGDQIRDTQASINALADELEKRLIEQRTAIDEETRQAADELKWHEEMLRSALVWEQARRRYYQRRQRSDDEPRDRPEGTSVASTVSRLMTEHRYPEPIKNAFMQRIKLESGFDPQAVSPGGTYHCLVQWDHHRYGQLLRFANYTPSRDYPCPSVEKQVGFIEHELNLPQYQSVRGRALRGHAYHVVTASYFGGRE